jgi:hypothetical protein
MNKWRRVYSVYHKVQQMVEDLESDETPVTLHEDRVIKKAKEFVDTVERHFPGIKQVFEKVGVPDDDIIAQALCCEVVLEVYHIPKKSDVMKKAGISVLPVPKRRKKEANESESKNEQENGRKSGKKSFQHDGKLLFAVTQLTVKLYHLIPRRKKDQKKIIWKAPKLLKKIWKYSRELQVTEESGRVGEALGVSGPSRLERVCAFDTRFAGGLRKQGRLIRYGASQGPKHPAVLTTTPATSNPPLLPPDTYRFTASMGSIQQYCRIYRIHYDPLRHHSQQLALQQRDRPLLLLL